MTRALIFRVRSIPRRRQRLRVLVTRHLVLGLMVFTAAIANGWLIRYSANLASVWVVNGLNIGMVLCINPKRRNELLIISYIANLLSNVASGITLFDSVGYAAADLIEIVVATYPFRATPVQAIDLTRIGTLVRAAAAAPVIGSAAATLALGVWLGLVTRHPATFNFLLTFYCSDALGAAIVVPLFWSWRRKLKIVRLPLFRYDAHVALLLYCVVVGGLFWQTKYPLLFLLFPVLIPVIYTGAFKAAAQAILFTAIAGIIATATGHGPLMLMSTTHEVRLIFLQFYLAIALGTALPFASLLMERERMVLRLKNSEARYRDLARLDGLTQLPNRREFDSFLNISRQRAVRQNTPLSLLLIDIDHFKKLNDQHGHTMGDEYLQRMAVAVASAVPRKTDLVARYGGEEFGVVLDSCDDPGAVMVAERIQAAVAALSKKLVAGNKPPVTVSIGMATTLPFMNTPSRDLIDAADQGLYTAKRNGRNRIERGTDLIAQATAALLTTHS